MEIKIITPVFNDWASCRELIRKTASVIKGGNDYNISFIVVDDGSIEEMPVDFNKADIPVRVIRLNRNVGHQRAIALGLCYLQDHGAGDFVIVMDADGEDKPEDIPHLLKAAKGEKGKIVFGTRSRRFEGFWFRFFYALYKVAFRLMTGRAISFGNYCAIPSERLKAITYLPDLWNHFSGGLIRSRIPYSTLPLERGKRYAGHSKMNFISLIIHGLSAISVYTDAVAVRILITTFTAICIAISGIVTVACIRFFTPLAIPGWASFVTLSFLIIIFQAFLISVLLIFSVLNYRTQRHFIPALEYKDYILETV